MTSKFSFGILALLVTLTNGARLPPPAAETALMARYIVNEADWASVATVSVRETSKGYPFVTLISESDGALGKGSGIPYLFITPLDFAGQDLEKDSRVTVLMSLAQGDFCRNKGYDPMDPRCARVIFTGRVKKVNKEDPEYETAKKAMFTRHEWLSHMPENHHFYFAKVEIETIVVLANFGYPKYITAKEYYSADEKDIEAYARRYKFHT